MGTNCFLSQCKRSLNSTTNKQKVPVGNYVQINNQDTTATCLDVIAVFVFGLNRFGYAIFKTNNHFHETLVKISTKNSFFISNFWHIFVFSSLLPHVFACLLNLFSRMKLFSLRVEPFQWHVRLYNHTKLVTSFSSLEGSAKVKLSGLGNIKHLSITVLTWITEFRYLRCIISYHIKREQQDSKAKHFCHKMKWKMGQKLLHNRRD